MNSTESPFHRYRDILLNQDYSAAQTLQSFTLSCWNGHTWKFQGHRLTNLDNEHLTIFNRMTCHLKDFRKLLIRL